jgi:hypothetical protein
VSPAKTRTGAEVVIEPSLLDVAAGSGTYASARESEESVDCALLFSFPIGMQGRLGTFLGDELEEQFGDVRWNARPFREATIGADLLHGRG